MRILLALIFFYSQVFAQVNRTVTGGRTPNLAGSVTNYVKNYGAEQNINDVTVSAAIVTRTTTTPLFGAASFLIDGTASGQTVKFDVNTYDNGVKGNCLASFWVNGNATLYKTYVEDGSGNKLTTDLQLSNYTQATPVQVNFVCTAGAKPVIETTSASAAAIRVDNVTSGIATNLGTVAQAQMVGRIVWPTTTNCIWQSTSSTYANFAADTDCGTPTTFGNASAPGTKIPGLVLSSMPAGNYQFVVVSNFTNSVSGIAGAFSHYRLSDGTNSTNGYSVFHGGSTGIGVGGSSYNMTTTTNQSNITIQFQSLTSAANTSQIFASSDTATLDIAVYYFPSQSQQVVSQASQGWFVAANIAGANTSLGNSNQASFVELTNASLTMTPVSGSAAVGIMCSGTNAAATPTTSTSTCSAGSESLGIAFNPPEAGWYKVCSQYSHYISNSGSSTVDATFSLIETPTNAQTLTQNGNARIPSGLLTASIAASNPMDVCGVFYFGSTSTKGVRLMYTQGVGGTPTDNFLILDALANLGLRNALFTVEKLSSGQNNPFVIGSVQSNTSGVERIERLSYNGTTGTIISQSGSWISSVTKGGSGQYTANISAGIFSGVPSCSVSAGLTSAAGRVGMLNGAPTTSTVPFGVLNNTFSYADSDIINIICQGPK